MSETATMEPTAPASEPAAPAEPVTLDDITAASVAAHWPTEPPATASATPDEGSPTDAPTDSGAATPEADASTESTEPTFPVELPLPNGAGVLDLELPTQEAADTLRHVLKQSERVPRLEAKLDQYQADAATVEFFDKNPAEAMLALATTKPDAAKAFMATYVAANPMETAQALAALGFDIVQPDDLKLQLITAKAEAAALKQKDAVAQAATTYRATSAQTRFVQAAGEVIRELADTAGFKADTDELDAFLHLASKRADKLFQTNPSATTADLAAALQPLLTPKNAPAATPHHAQTQPRDAAGQFAAQAQAKKARQDTLRKFGGGASAPTAVTAQPVPTGTTLYDIAGIKRR